MKNESVLINKIALGTVQFGLEYGISNKNGITEIDEVERIINRATDYKIDTFIQLIHMEKVKKF